MKLLVTGGAGYVGSACATLLLERGHEVTIIDDLSTGNGNAVPAGADFIEADIAEDAHELLSKNNFDGVMHFAAQSLVGESMVVPEKYWSGNVITTIKLLEAIRLTQTPRLVFSSTAATYGEPESIPITEDCPTKPTNPYGATKLAIDHAISSYCTAHGLAATSLRYFNVAGAYRNAGENRVIETHLIPLVLQVALGQRDKILVFGEDWPTADGTAIRDYIHVFDLAEAHLLALEATTPGSHAIYNLGSGSGFSVREVISACERVTGRDIATESAGRRAGDPAVLIASSEHAINELGWKPLYTDLDTIVSDAWQFLKKLGSNSHAAQHKS
ncbi:MAG: UDP-glucose 4-epimerase GalE [Mycobacteriaceae bacterium]